MVNTDNVRQKWEQDLHIEIQKEYWSYICRQVHKCPYDLRHKLASIKMKHMIYYTPEKLCKMKSEMSFLCWLCKKQKGTFFHMSWSCDSLSFLGGNSVIQLISQFLHVSIPLSPCLCLLGTSMFDKWNKHQSRYIDLAMLAASKCITLKWKESKPPVIVHWWNQLSSYHTLDCIYYRSTDRSSEIWQSHVEFAFMSVLGQYKA